MTERLSDERVAHFATNSAHRYSPAGHLAREVQQRRADDHLVAKMGARLDIYDRLLNGGPCETCAERRSMSPCESKRPHKPHRYQDRFDDWNCPGVGPCLNPDCEDGRVPGLIERLEAIEDRLLDRRMRDDATDTLTAVIAELRKAVGP